MAVNEVLKKAIEKQFLQQGGKALIIRDMERVGGGDTNHTYKLDTNGEPLFLKCGEAHPFPDFFDKEMEGLVCLSEAKTVAVPAPLLSGRTGEQIFLVMEYIHKQPADTRFWNLFAEALAGLHRQTGPQFGFTSDNYIGLLPQSNRPHTTWPSFYQGERLEPLIRKCIDKGLLEPAILPSCNALYRQLENLFPEEKPALIHGDLWGGNYLPGPEGRPFLFDPAVYYGSREMDMAMTRLFGGFDRQFYWHYEEIYPLPEGWQQRISLCQLYPLLVHALLFGGGYVQRVKNILSAY